MNGQNTNNYVNNGPAFSSNQVVSGNQAMTKVKTRYKYVAYDKNGKQVKGYFDAFRRMDVESFLTAQGYKILDIKAKKISKAGDFFTFSNEMKYKDLVFFLTQLSTYIKSGIPLTESLVMIENQTKDKKKKDLYKRIVYELNTGANFSEALARQGNVFPKLLINMLKTSELTGNLTESLDDMAAYYKTADSNRKQVISALTYPSVVLVISIAVLTFLLIFIIPKFQSIFDQLGSNLPGITLFLINMSTFLQNNVIKIVLAIFASIIIIVMLYRHVKKFRYCVQWVAMHIPVIKDVLIDNEVVMFTKTFSSLIRHDVFITDSIEMLGKITNNEIYKDIIKEAVTNLSAGAGLSPAFENKWAFPRIAYEMLVTGEKTGRLGVMMENVANYYEEEQKNLIQRLKSLIEPVMIIVLAFIVGVILLAIFIPMFSIYSDIL
ncbi:MAG: type II secretion system F family protein [Bacilli bacterium]|nr:type II secretion system F family protein [Bacilli bacterium]